MKTYTKLEIIKAIKKTLKENLNVDDKIFNDILRSFYNNLNKIKESEEDVSNECLKMFSDKVLRKELLIRNLNNKNRYIYWNGRVIGASFSKITQIGDYVYEIENESTGEKGNYKISNISKIRKNNCPNVGDLVILRYLNSSVKDEKYKISRSKIIEVIR